MFTTEFWKRSTERAIKTFAQFVVTLGTAGAFNVLAVDWQTVLGLGLGAAVLSYATSIASIDFGDKGTPSLVKEEK